MYLHVLIHPTNNVICCLGDREDTTGDKAEVAGGERLPVQGGEDVVEDVLMCLFWTTGREVVQVCSRGEAGEEVSCERLR